MALQVVGAGELAYQLVHDLALLVAERVGVGGVHGGEVARHERPGAPVYLHGSGVQVDLVQQQAVFHVELGMAPDDGALKLEQQHVDGLDKGRDGLAVAIRAVGKRHQCAQRDAVVVLKDLVVAVAQVVAQHGDDARGLAGGGAHPQDVVVAPLHVQALRVAALEPVHDLGRAAAAVEDVAHQVDVVHGQALDELGQRADEVLGGIGFQDRVDDALVVAHAVVVLVGVRVQQLVDDIGVVVRDGAAHLGAGVAAGELARHGDELPQHGLVPGGGVLPGLAHQLDLLARVVDERAQVVLCRPVQLALEDDIHVLAHNARAVVEDVHEGLVLAVEVAHEVLGALGQVENSLQVDDLGERRLLVGKLLREQREVLHGLLGTIGR